MGRARSVLGTIVFLVVAPGAVAGLVPYLLNHWRPGSPLLGLEALRWLGLMLMIPALLLLLDAFARFAWEGRGTPAPIAPTERLVASGPYRLVRNPMYLAVVSLILGQGLLFGSLATLAYGGAAWLAMHLFVVFYEEPRLLADHPDYEAYRNAVPRWLPRLAPRQSERWGRRLRPRPRNDTPGT
jgi:protein-S-isoprenylcysteine O-methyltransferase Ste14